MARKDAKRIPFNPLMQCAVDLKPRRSVSDVYINHKMDVTELVRWMDEQKAAGKKLTYFHAFMAAIGKVIYLRPKLNRFIANRHLYEHNDVSLGFVAKVTLDDHSEEMMMILGIDPEDTVWTLADKLANKVGRLRRKETSKKGANSATDVLAKLPNIIRVPVFNMILWADAHGVLPEGLHKDNIYYTSMIVSNLGSIGCGAIYHNLNDFGSCSSLTTIGEIKPEKVILPDGSEAVRMFCELGITLDERIGDGFYFARCCKLIEYILQHPETLEDRADAPVDMPKL